MVFLLLHIIRKLTISNVQDLMAMLTRHRKPVKAAKRSYNLEWDFIHPSATRASYGAQGRVPRVSP